MKQVGMERPRMHLSKGTQTGCIYDGVDTPWLHRIAPHRPSHLTADNPQVPHQPLAVPQQVYGS